jgi:hypothetical protein
MNDMWKYFDDIKPRRENFLEETIEKIEESGHHIGDVLWVGSQDGTYAISFTEFEKIADLEYCAGHGCSGLVRDIVVVFDDGSWLERAEYDDAEWWEYKKTPLRSAKTMPKAFTELREDHFENTIEEVNE